MKPSSPVLRLMRRSWDTVGLALLLTAFLVNSASLSRTAAWIPQIVLTLALVLTLVQLVIEAREQFGAERAARERSSDSGIVAPAGDIGPIPTPARPARGIRPIAAALWVGGLLGATLLFGTTAGSAVFCFAYLRWHSREKLLTSVVFAALVTAAIHLTLETLLHASLYPGLLFR